MNQKRIALQNKNEHLSFNTQVHVTAQSVTFHNTGTASVRLNSYPLAPGAMIFFHCSDGEVIDSLFNIEFDTELANGKKSLWLLKMVNSGLLEQSDI